jgi:hypothetical protein
MGGSTTDSKWSDWFKQDRSSARNKHLNVLQLKDGKYQADLTIQMAEDLLPAEISGKVKNVAQKCRNAGDGK